MLPKVAAPSTLRVLSISTAALNVAASDTVSPSSDAAPSTSNVPVTATLPPTVKLSVIVASSMTCSSSPTLTFLPTWRLFPLATVTSVANVGVPVTVIVSLAALPSVVSPVADRLVRVVAPVTPRVPETSAFPLTVAAPPTDRLFPVAMVTLSLKLEVLATPRVPARDTFPVKVEAPSTVNAFSTSKFPPMVTSSAKAEVTACVISEADAPVVELVEVVDVVCSDVPPGVEDAVPSGLDAR